ncbi:MAG: hypothetical protein COA79_25800 [Planctomycetota bacterium]|nr:MAG: hypothetical protein COA79_25800 [Planctomycetota bacterium]
MSSKKYFAVLLPFLATLIVGVFVYFSYNIITYLGILNSIEDIDPSSESHDEKLIFNAEAFTRSIKLELVQSKDVVFTKSEIPALISMTTDKKFNLRNYSLKVNHILICDGVKVESWSQELVPKPFSILGYQKGFSVDTLGSQKQVINLAYHISFSLWKGLPESSSFKKAYESKVDAVRLHVKKKS